MYQDLNSILLVAAVPSMSSYSSNFLLFGLLLLFGLFNFALLVSVFNLNLGVNSVLGLLLHFLDS